MRFARILGSDPASARLEFYDPVRFWLRSASYFSRTKSAKRLTATSDPWGELVKKFPKAYKKTPLMQLTSGTVSYVTLQTSAPASTLSLPPTVDPPARCSRGQVQSTSPIHVTNSNPESNLSTSELIDFVEIC